MLCLSHQGTLNAIDELCADFDEDVLHWRNTLMSSLDPLLTEVNIQLVLHGCMCMSEHILS